MRAVSEFLLIAGGRLVTALLVLVAIRVSTTLLPPDEYGVLSLLIAFQFFCGLFLINPVGQHVTRHTHEWWQEGSLLARLRRFRGYVLAVAVLGGVLAGLWSLQLGRPGIGPWLAAFAVGGMVLAVTWNATLVTALNMLGHRGSFVVWSVVSTLVGLLAGGTLANWQPAAELWLLGQVVGLTLGALGARAVLRRHAGNTAKGVGDPPLVTRATITQYCLPLAAATGFMWVYSNGYRLVVGELWGLAELGLLVLGLGLAVQLFGLLESLAMQFVYPHFIRRLSDPEELDGRNALSDLINLLGPLYVVAAGLAVLGAKPLVQLLAAPQFAGAWPYLALGALVELCRSLGNLVGNAAQVTRETRSLIAPHALAAGIAVLGVTVLGTRGGPIGWVAGVLIVGAVALLALLAVKMRRQVAYRLDLGRWAVAAAIFAGLAALAGRGVDGLKSVVGDVLVVQLLALSMLFALVAVVLTARNPARVRMFRRPAAAPDRAVAEAAGHHSGSAN